MNIHNSINFVITFSCKVLLVLLNWTIWFLGNASMKDRGEFIINFVIYLTLIFAIIYFCLVKGYEFFYSKCKKTSGKTFKKVLVTGDFGSGKTHFVNHNEDLFKFLELKSESVSKLENYDKKLYISCTGKTSSEILKELYFDLLPKPIKFFESKNTLDMISHVFHVRKYDVSDIKDYILKSASQKYDVIIIDDFERMCFGESINDEIHQFTRLILDKLVRYFHIVFVHSTNSRMFADNQYKLNYRGSTKDSYNLEYIDNFDSNIGYLLEKTEWDMEQVCETNIKKCSNISKIYEKWQMFLGDNNSSVINYVSLEIEKLNKSHSFESHKNISKMSKQLLKYYSTNEKVKKMFSLLIIETVYKYIKKQMYLENNTNNFNYRTALNFANSLANRDINKFFNTAFDNIVFAQTLINNKNILIEMYNEVKEINI